MRKTRDGNASRYFAEMVLGGNYIQSGIAWNRSEDLRGKAHPRSVVSTRVKSNEVRSGIVVVSFKKKCRRKRNGMQFPRTSERRRPIVRGGIFAGISDRDNDWYARSIKLTPRAR